MLVRMTRFAGANEIAGYTRIEIGSFAPTTVVVMTASPITHVRTLIDFSPSASSGFHRTAVSSATGGPLNVRRRSGTSKRREARAGSRVHARLGSVLEAA